MSEPIPRIQTYLMDMDGVFVRGTQLIPGADGFIERLRKAQRPFTILTNNSMYTPRDLQARLERIGLSLNIEEIFTSGMATAQFLQQQMPNGTVYVIGESGLTTALHDAGFILTDVNPDYVVLGETITYSFQRLTQAIRLILNGARFIATNPDVIGPTETGLVPATGAVAALIAAWRASAVPSCWTIHSVKSFPSPCRREARRTGQPPPAKAVAAFCAPSCPAASLS